MAIDEVSYTGQQYKLRAGSAMPINRGVTDDGGGDFVLHTFMAELNDIEVIICTTELPGSEQFRGQGGDLISASFTRLNVVGGEVFSGKKIYAPEYVDEDAYV